MVSSQHDFPRHLLRRLSTGEVIDLTWTQFSFSTSFHYEALHGPEYLRSAGITPDARMTEAINLIASKHDSKPVEHAARITSVGLVFSM